MFGRMKIDVSQMQTKTTMRYQLTPVRMASLNKSINNPDWCCSVGWASTHKLKCRQSRHMPRLWPCPLLGHM